MLRRRDALLLLALASGCRAGPTALDVSVTFDDARHHPGSLAVTIRIASMKLKMDTTVAPGSRPIQSGDDFIVILPDADDGKDISVDVATALDRGGTIRGTNHRVVSLHQMEPLAIVLGEVRDGGVDLETVRDLGRPPTDACPTTCEADAGEESSCLPDGAVVTRLCGFGCKGSSCRLPNTCVGHQADISTAPAGTYEDNTAGLMTSAINESCAMHSGPDAVMSLGLTDWSDVTIDTVGSSFDTVLFLRTVCSDASSELPLAGPCPGASTNTTATTCNDNAPDLPAGASRLVLCGLPPRSFDVWLAAKKLGGDYRVNVAIQPVSLQTCAEAGQLIQNWNLEATTAGHANNFSSNGLGSCSLHRGENSPDAVFFFTLTAPHDVLLSTEGTQFPHSLYARKGACGELDIGCALAINPPARLELKGLAPDTYFVIVDGINGTSGPLTLTLTYTK